MSTDAFDTFIARNDPPLIIATTSAGNDKGGCLVGFHAQASIEPELYAVWLSRANRTTELARQSNHLVVHYLQRDQIDIAAHFGSLTGDKTDKFATIPWTLGPHGLPLITECPNYLILHRTTLVDESDADHLCWLGRVETAHVSEQIGRPFRLADATPLTPGHEADD
jgi:flavin reductase (DIM6/NTAB) family NADH-FMN oxidoreductase RutF